ncbi:MAG: phytanoyl-CoA dioxygenase family protein [Lysobacterales bacterium]
MTRDLSTDELAAYQRDGVVRIKNAVSQQWIDSLTMVVEGQLENPSRWVNDANPDASTNRMFTDRYQWRSNAVIKNYVFESGIGQLAAHAMQSDAARFYFDHTLVKEPGTQAITPWHQDLPYWPFRGKQICSIWLALTDTTVAESAMEFVRGSHAQEIYYLPEVFGDRDEHPADWIREGEGEPIPDVENHREDYDIIGWDMEAGDVVIFSAWLLHWAPGNESAHRRRAAISTRWLGDDAVWHPHPGADPTVTQDHVSLAPGDLAHDDEVFPLVWPP